MKAKTLFNPKALTRARKAAKLSEKDLAMRLFALGVVAGVHTHSIRKYEAGQVKPSCEVLAGIAAVTGKPLESFFLPRRRVG